MMDLAVKILFWISVVGYVSVLTLFIAGSLDYAILGVKLLIDAIIKKDDGDDNARGRK